MDEFDFDLLVTEIREGLVVPIIGTELYARADGTPYEPEIIARLAAELRLEPQPPMATPRDVALAHKMQKGGGPNAFKTALQKVIKELINAPPEPLVQLAEIRGLKMYVTTTFDDLLEQALRSVGRSPLPYAHSTSPAKSKMDLHNLKESTQPAVCHVLGQHPDCATTDASVLEFLGAMLDDVRRPRRLFEELEGKDLLFLGCGFPDWLSRLFIRVIKDKPFTDADQRTQLIADARIASDSNLVLFLSGHDLMLYPPGGARDFVRELHRTWIERFGREEPQPPPPLPEVATLTKGAVFLSFSSEDRDIVRPIAEALHDAGIDVFFDEKNIDWGDEWDRVITTNVRRAELFVPFVSQRTEKLADTPKYFWKEWNIASRHAESYAPGAKFILPVGLDRLEPESARVPEAFRDLHWFWMQPEKLGALVEYIRDAYRRKQTSRVARST